MKAATYEQYGSADVVHIADIARPEIGDNQILVRNHATTVTTADWRLRASAFPGVMWPMGRLMFGLFRPRNKVLGSEFAGRVVAVGANVTRFRMGDPVFGFSMSGAHAEYVAVAEDGPVTRKPAAIGYDEAAAIPFGALAALVFLRDIAHVGRGQKVLVLGAAGGVGVFAVQLARHFGAEVTAVAGAANLDLVRALGADHVMDYRKEDFAAAGKRWDLVFDPVGATNFAKARRALKPTGAYLPLEFGVADALRSLVARIFGGPKLLLGISGDAREDLEFVAGLVETGELRAVIDSHYPFARIADAHRRVETRRKTGSVVVMLDESPALAAAA